MRALIHLVFSPGVFDFKTAFPNRYVFSNTQLWLRLQAFYYNKACVGMNDPTVQAELWQGEPRQIWLINTGLGFRVELLSG